MDCNLPGSSAMEFSSQQYWSGLPCPPPQDLPNLGIKLVSPVSPALAGGFLTTRATWEAPSPQPLLKFCWRWSDAGNRTADVLKWGVEGERNVKIIKAPFLFTSSQIKFLARSSGHPVAHCSLWEESSPEMHLCDGCTFWNIFHFLARRKFIDMKKKAVI